MISDGANKLVSAVVTTYNRASMVGEAIESVLRQSYPNIQPIVVDHASDDDTPEVLRGFGDRIEVLAAGPQSRGVVAAARNVGISASRGSFVAFLDDDDLWEPEKIARQVDAMLAQENVILVSTDARVVGQDGNDLDRRYLEHTKAPSGEVFERLVADNTIICSSVLVRRDSLVEVGCFDERRSLAMVEDYHLWLRLSARGRLVHIDEPLVRYRRHAGHHGQGDALEGVRRRRRVLRASLEDPVVSARASVVRRQLRREALQGLRLIVRGRQ